jgi:hypothetical protein
MTEPVSLIDLPIEVVALADLRPHPRNYRNHPDDQIEHIMQSIRENGFYRNIVISSDNFILAGHGVARGAKALEYTEVPVRRLEWHHLDIRALKVLAGDNEIAHLSENDDRMLSEILKQIHDEDETGLLGTGYDPMMLQNLVFVTRPEDEITDHNEAAQWVGMPEYDEGKGIVKLVVSFRSETDREQFMTQNGITKISGGWGPTKSAWWPPKDKEDLASLRFEG